MADRSHPRQASDVVEAILAFDGTHVGELRSALRAQPDLPDLDQILDLVGRPNPPYQIAATWLIKAFLEDGGRLPRAEAAILTQALPRLAPWQARLHILQSLRHWPAEALQNPALARFVEANRGDSKTFVRVWALDALVHLSDHVPSLRPEAMTATKTGLNDPAASLRARAHQLWATRWG